MRGVLMIVWQSQDGEKVYRTGGGDRWYYWRTAGVVVFAVAWVALFLWSGGAREALVEVVVTPSLSSVLSLAFCLLFPVGLFAVVIWTFMHERNATVTVSESGLVVQNWRKARRLIPWDSILAVIWRNIRTTGLTGSTYWLVLYTEHARGRRHRINIGYGNYSDPQEIEELRDETISRRGLPEAHDKVSPVFWRIARLLGIREIRIWRQDDLIR